ncbi:MAG: radical SAM protein [Polyangiaceae bacterium]
MKPQNVVLVGPIQQENLALQYLAASARKVGHRVRVVSYGDRRELERALDSSLAGRPDVIGMGIAFQNHIEDYLAFMQAVRPRGFGGHLTCGGHVPTFCYPELMRDVPGLDTCVRHDGEETFVELLERLGCDEPARDIAGLVWRDGDQVVVGPVRKPRMDLDNLPEPARSEVPYSVGGLAVDFLITARGCVGECNYCSIAAFTAEQSVAFRLRKPDPVAEEIASAYHQRGARVIFVQDDLFVLPSERKSVERANAMRDGLRARGVDNAVLWVKGRPETITGPVAAALADLGVIHMFLGVENAAATRLDYLGRTHLPLHNESAIAISRKHGITPSFNFMLFDPDCSLDDIEPTLRMAEDNLDLPWNVCRTEIYSGTALRARLEREGRLEGDYRSYGYRMRDERAEIMFRLMRVILHERSLALESLLNRLISLSFARQLHEHFFPGAATDTLAGAANRLGCDVRRDTVDMLRRLRDFAAGPAARDKDKTRRFAVDQALDIQARDLPWRARADELWGRFNARGAAFAPRLGVTRNGPVRASWAVASGS